MRIGWSDARKRPYASDGKRFLVFQQASDEADAPVEVIRNWTVGLAP